MLILRSRATFSIARAQILPKYTILRTVAPRRFLTSAATQSNPKLERSQDLIAKGSALLANGEFQEAYPLLATALELQQKFEGNLEGSDAATLYLKLGLAYHHLGKPVPAEENFLKAIKTLSAVHGETDRDVGLAYQYYAELLASLDRNQEALDNIKKAVSIIRNYHQDVYLGGALANQATILTLLGDYESALQSCTEALNLFIADLGRDNPHTRRCFGNMYLILKKLGKSDTELRQKWETSDKITQQDFKGLTDQEVSDTLQEFAWSIKKAEPKFNPPGFTKGPDFAHKQLEQFLELWNKRGNTLDEPQIQVLAQEFEHHELGEQTRAILKKKLREQRNLVVERRKGDTERDSERLRIKAEEKRMKREARVFNHERKYTERVMHYVGMKYDDGFTSRAHRKRVYEAELAEITNPEGGQTEIPQMPKAKDVLWHLEFRDYEDPNVDWRKVPVTNEATYVPGDDDTEIKELIENSKNPENWIPPKLEDPELQDDEEETISEGHEIEQKPKGPRRTVTKKAERE